MFDRVDEDADGYISKDEVQRIKKSCDGAISINKIAA